MRKPEQSTYMWLRRLNATPKSIWKMPRITDIFILKELRKASLLLAIFQICGKTTPSQIPGEGKQEKENTPFKLNSMNQSGSVRLKKQVFKNVIVLFILGK